jgi:NAD(P)-dependent dehydrogenase (short-subunit alcohol dehydrogenase family)
MPERSMSDSLDLFALDKGLRVLVTAGASGIGRAISDLLIARGARVHICDVSDEFLAQYRVAHRDATLTKADVSSESDVARLFAEVKTTLGGLDVLVNNAGVAGPTGGVEEIRPEDWRRTIDVCLTGQFLCAHHGVPMLKAAGGGAIVNLSSAAGRFGYAFRTPYSAAKWGVIGLTQSLAKELGPANIRVNAILPSIVEGARMTGVIAARAKQTNVTYEAMEKRYLERVSLRRMVTAGDVAAMVAYLLSPAGRNVSGQSLGVDGNVETL